MTTHRVAYNVLDSVLRNGAYLHLALKEGLKYCSSENAAAVTALVYAAVENVKYSDYIISHYTKGRLHGSIRLVLRIGIAELLTMETAPYAVCDECVKLVKSIGKAELSGFVNGVLRSIARTRGSLPPLPEDASAYLQIKYGIPEFLAAEYLEAYGKEFTEAMLKNKFRKLTIRAQYPCAAEELAGGLLEKDAALGNIPYHFGRLVPEAIILDKGADITASPLFINGKISVQSESAMLVCKICRVESGMNILDACAAPGGKSAYLASLMRDIGSITAWDLHENRVKLMEATLERLRVACVKCARQDALRPVPGLYESMDLVLVDAPCSGFGVGSKPDTYLNRTEQDVGQICKIQRSILEECSKYVRRGGALVYATCTISKRENESNVLEFLEAHKEFTAEDFSDLLPGEYRERCRSGMLQLFPNLDGMDGFFIARLVKEP